MKKCKIIITAALALTMTACADTGTSEVTTVPDVETEESVTTGSEETAVETEAASSETEETTTEEVTTVSETETETESSSADIAEEPNETIELSFYEKADERISKWIQKEKTSAEYIDNMESSVKKSDNIPKSAGLAVCDLSNTDKEAFIALYRQHHLLPDNSNENDISWIWSNEKYFTVGGTDYLYLASTAENVDFLYDLTSMKEYNLTRVSDGYCAIAEDENGVYLIRTTEGELWLDEAVFDLTNKEAILSNGFVYDTLDEVHEHSPEMAYYMGLEPYAEFIIQ